MHIFMAKAAKSKTTFPACTSFLIGPFLVFFLAEKRLVQCRLVFTFQYQLENVNHKVLTRN